MAVWASRARRPNTQRQRNYHVYGEYYQYRNYNLCTVTPDETDVNTIRNKNAYTMKDYMYIGKFCTTFGVNGEYYKEQNQNGTLKTEKQESESLEPGYAPRKQYKSLLLAALVYSNLETAKGMEEALQKLAEVNAQTLAGIQTLAEEIRNSAAAGSQRETGLTRAFQETLAAVHQQNTEAQQALASAHSSAATTFEEIGASLERAVKERKPGEVELHKLVKAPDPFNPGNWQEEKAGWIEFRNRMRVWLGAVDNSMIRIMDRVETDLKDDKMVRISDMSTEAKEASRRLYSVLSSYTKGRPYRVVKHVAEENGMEAYRMLLKEYQPTNRARSLELFHNILNYRFPKDKGIAESILEYEERIEQYEKATGEKVQENLKVSTLIQGMKPEVKRHLLLNMDEKTKYSALRQYLVNYESTERWTNSLTQNSQRTTTDLIDKGEDHGGLAMMDVSQAWYKGKGKWNYKGLGKGKGK
ncbi:unnamed protein product, partial [Symbiodinium microadriaticum]